MSEKRSRDDWRILYRQCNEEALWQVVQSHCEAIRAEVRKEVTEEILKTHYEIGEHTVSAHGEDCIVAMWTLKTKEHYTDKNWGGSRPQKMRDATRLELEKAIHYKTGIDWLRPYLGALSLETVKAMAHDLGIPTEVTE